MSGLTGKGGQPANEFIGIVVQTSLKGQVIPRGWGTFKADCNLVDYLNFQGSVAGGGKASGKGGGGGKNSGQTYNYTANIVLGIVGQQIHGIRAIWRDADVLIDGTSSSTSLPAPFAQAVFSLANYQSASGSTVTSTTSSVTESALAQAGLSLANGALGQSPPSAVSGYNATTYWMYNANQTATYDGSSHALGYSGLANVSAANYALNSGATPPNHSFEVQTLIRQVIGGQTYDDANPADIVNDFLPSIPQWPAGIIAGTTGYYNYCLAAGLLISPYADDQRTGADLLTEILACSNSNAFMSNGQLQIVPYGDTAVSGNGVSWTPDLTPVYTLDWSDILDGGADDPIKWDIKPDAQCYNYVQVSYTDRTNQYVADMMPAYDQANINQYGLCKQDPVTLNSICLPTVAQTISQLIVQRTANIRQTCTFKVPWTFDLLDPMDLIEVPLRNGGTQLVRITETQEKDGEITITAEEMLVGTTHAAEYTRQTSIASGTNMNVNPGSVGTPLVIHPPAAIVNDNEIWIAACSNYALWGGAVVWVSTDGTNYNPVGNLRGASAMGVLSAGLATFGGTNPDTADTLAVDMSLSAFQLDSVTATDAATGVTLAIIDDELVTFETATLTAFNQYSLTTLYRGFGGTTPAAHTAGTPIVFLHGQLFKYAFDSTQLGKTLYFKLQSFNIYGSGQQNLAACTAWSVTLAQTYDDDVAWADVAGIPANIAALTGTEAIQNSILQSSLTSGAVVPAQSSTITGQGPLATSALAPAQVANANININPNGTLGGAGTGQVTIGGLGYSGSLVATQGGNVVWSTIFQSGSCGAWGSPDGTGLPGSGVTVYAAGGPDGSGELQCTDRDTLELGNIFPVTPGQVFYVDTWCWNDSSGSYTANIGLHCTDASGGTPQWIAGAALAPGNGWTHIAGTLTIPSGAAYAQPWLQNAGASTGNPYISWDKIYIGTAQPGADVTGQNTSNNTSNVGSIPAGAVSSTINSGGGVGTNQVVTESIVLGNVTTSNVLINWSGSGSSSYNTQTYHPSSGGNYTICTSTPAPVNTQGITYTSAGGNVRVDFEVSDFTGVLEFNLIRIQGGTTTVLNPTPYIVYNDVNAFFMDTGASAGTVEYALQLISQTVIQSPTGGTLISSGTATATMSYSGLNMITTEFKR